MRYVLSLLLLALVGGALYVRFAPSDVARWHVDPLTATDPGAAGTLLRPGPEAPIYPLPASALLERFDAIALSTQGVTRLAGSVADGHITYVARSRVFGFPDYISVKTVPAQNGAQLAVFSRLRFGAADVGVNAKRLATWITALEGA